MTERRRRFIVAICVSLAVCAGTVYNGFIQPQLADTESAKHSNTQTVAADQQAPSADQPQKSAQAALQTLAIKGRAPKTGYSRDQFGDGWAEVAGCSMRNIILRRDLEETAVNADGCAIESGTLQDIYTNKTIAFLRGENSAAVQIDHIVALSDAWQKGAQQISRQQRESLANDPLNLIAVDGPTNQAKGDGDAATWLPPNKSYRCRYVARQIAVKVKYMLWATPAEHEAMGKVLDTCPGQMLPTAKQPGSVAE